MSVCRACGAEIRWARTAAKGRPIPLDVEPNPDGNVIIEDGLAIVLGAPSLLDGERWMPHMVTCPQASSFKR